MLKKITATQAKAKLKLGLEIIICPSKCSPYSLFASRHSNKVILSQWDSFINNYKYYNCNSETGNTLHFYFDESK